MRGVWLSVVLTLAIQSLVSLAVFTPPVLAPAAQAQLGIPASAVGIATSLIYVSAAFAALTSAGVIGRFGPMRVSQGSLTLCAIGMGLIASASLPLIALGALIIGLGYGPVTPSSSAILADRAPANLRSLIFSIKQTGVPIGGALAGALIPALIGMTGWRAAALVSAAACAVLALVVQPWRGAVDRETRAGSVRNTPGLVGPLKLVLAHPALRKMAWAGFAYSGMQMCLGSFLVVYFHERVGFSVPAAGAALSVAMAAGIMGRIVWGIVADRWMAPMRLLGVLGIAMSAAAFVMAAVGTSWPLPLVLALCAVYGATAVGWNGVYLAELARLVPAAQAAAATGGSLAMTYSGVVTMPAAFWAIVTVTRSYAAAFVALGCLTLWRASFFMSRKA